MRATGCLFVTSAVEAVDDALWRGCDWVRHTRADFARAAGPLRGWPAAQPDVCGLYALISRAGYLDLLDTIAELGLVEHVAPIQYAIRLLILAPAAART